MLGDLAKLAAAALATLALSAAPSGAIFTDAATNGSNTLSTAASFSGTFAVTHAVTGAGTSSTWTNPADAGADDNITATRSPARRSPSTSYWAIDPFTEIPTGSTVNSVTVGIRVHVTSNQTVVLSRALTNNTTVVGTASALTGINNTTEALVTHSAGTVTLAQLKHAALQIRTVDDKDDSNATVLHVDYLYVTVSYTTP